MKAYRSQPDYLAEMTSKQIVVSLQNYYATQGWPTIPKWTHQVTRIARRRLSALVSAAIVLTGNLRAAAQVANTPPTDTETEINKKLSNPISSIWALQIQQNTYFIYPGVNGSSSRNAVNVQFQPVLPLALTDDWNLITRPVFQVVNSVPAINHKGDLYQATGFGDTILATMLSASPKLAGPWLFGAGPSFIFPTATTTNVGQKKWQLGPARVIGYLGEHFIVGVFPNSGSQLRVTARSRPVRSICNILSSTFCRGVGRYGPRRTCWSIGIRAQATRSPFRSGWMFRKCRSLGGCR